jgi:hypothetical protein
MHHTPSYAMDDAIQLLRTQQEEKEHEYPDSVFTSCFYTAIWIVRTMKRPCTNLHPASQSQVFLGNSPRDCTVYSHLQPSQVLRRNKDAKGQSAMLSAC